MRLAAFAAVGLSALSVPIFFAQQPSPAALRIELIERLLSGVGIGNAKLMEGLPAEFPPELVPDGARPVMAMTSARTTLVLAEADDFSDVARTQYERKRVAAGWKEVEAGGGRGLSMSANEPVEMLCRDGSHASYSVSPRRGGGSWLHLTVSRYGGGCPETEPFSRGGPMRMIFDDERMPVLAPPENSDVQSMQSGSSDMFQSQDLTLKTAMPFDDVANHYTALMTRHGWTLDGNIGDSGIAARRFMAPLGTANKPVPVRLLVMPSGPESVAVSLMVYVPPSR